LSWLVVAHRERDEKDYDECILKTSYSATHVQIPLLYPSFFAVLFFIISPFFMVLHVGSQAPFSFEVTVLLLLVCFYCTHTVRLAEDMEQSMKDKEPQQWK
jgi:hypothetical protein